MEASVESSRMEGLSWERCEISIHPVLEENRLKADYQLEVVGASRMNSVADFCLIECISPSTLAGIAEAHLPRLSADETWKDIIGYDLGLRVACATARFLMGYQPVEK